MCKSVQAALQYKYMMSEFSVVNTAHHQLHLISRQNTHLLSKGRYADIWLENDFHPHWPPSRI